MGGILNGMCNASLQGKRAVIAEDQGVTQLQLKRILAGAGILVVGMAANGYDAIELALRTRPDMVLLDIEMPLMNGIEAAREIGSVLDTCILLLTAYSDEDHQAAAELLGVHGYITKPFTGVSLIPSLIEAMEAYDRRLTQPV